MSLSIEITDSVKTIEKNINSAIADYLNNKISNKQTSLLNQAKGLIPGWINSQPEIISLLSNDPQGLIGQFGISSGGYSIVNSIINAIVGSTALVFKKFTPRLSGGIELQFQPANFANLLSLPEGHTIYRGGDLHWLDWLLNRGDTIIVVNYQYNPNIGLGRSKLGNMIPGGSFRVPQQFSGTKDNNFITRAFSGPQQEKDLTDLFNKILS